MQGKILTFFPHHFILTLFTPVSSSGLFRFLLQRKFEEFGQRAKANLSPLVAEYEVMFEEGRSNLRRIREHVDEMTELYFEVSLQLPE